MVNIKTKQQQIRNTKSMRLSCIVMIEIPKNNCEDMERLPQLCTWTHKNFNSIIENALITMHYTIFSFKQHFYRNNNKKTLPKIGIGNNFYLLPKK